MHENAISPSMISNGFVVDNSSLNLILKDKTLSEPLFRMPINLIIPKETYVEAHSGQAKYIYPRMVELANLNKGTRAARFYFAPSFFNALAREARRGGALKAIPVLPPEVESKHFEIFSSIERYEAFRQTNLNQGIEWMSGAKDRVLNADKTQQPLEDLSDDQIRNIIKNYRGVTKIGEIRSSFLPLYTEVISKRKLRAALYNNRHLHLKAYISAVTLRDLGNIIRNFEKNDDLLFLKEKKKGNWYDLYFIGWSADKFNLLTEDRDLRRMHGFFKERGLNRTVALSVDEVLGTR